LLKELDDARAKASNMGKAVAAEMPLRWQKQKLAEL
jgi:hypothetical protein